MQKIVLASNNQGKLREFAQMVAEWDYRIVPQSELGIDAAAETGTTFVENAILKARHAAQCSKLPAFADDSGIEVDALQGQPGVCSARFAGEQATDSDNNVLLLEKLRDVPDEQRTARYHCIIVLMRHADDPTPLICQGTWEGRILHEPRGSHGFGYDPFFYVPTHNCSAAELTSETKNQLSHRGQALRALQQALANGYAIV